VGLRDLGVDSHPFVNLSYSKYILYKNYFFQIRPRINPLYWPLHESSPQSGTETPLPAAISDDDGNK